MKTRTRNALFMACVLGAGAVGLSLFARYKKLPELRGRSLDAIPNGAIFVATADLAALRTSAVGAPFLKEGRKIQGVGKVKDVCGFDPIDTLEDVVIAIPAAGESGEFGLAASGIVDDEALLGCAQKIIQARGGRPVITNVGTFRSVHDGSASGPSGGEIAVRKGGPLLLGAGAYLRAMIDAAEGKTPSIRASVAHNGLARELGDGAARVTFVLTPEQRKSIGQEVDRASAILAGGAGIELGPIVKVHAVLACDTPESATALARAFATTKQARAKEVALRLVGFGAVLDKLSIEPAGALVHFRVGMPAEEAGTLADRVLALRGFRHPMPSDAPSAPPSGEPSAPKPDEVLPAKPPASASARPKDPPAASSK